MIAARIAGGSFRSTTMTTAGVELVVAAIVVVVSSGGGTAVEEMIVVAGTTSVVCCGSVSTGAVDVVGRLALVVEVVEDVGVDVDAEVVDVDVEVVDVEVDDVVEEGGTDFTSSMRRATS